MRVLSFRSGVLALLFLTLLPAAAHAQSQETGAIVVSVTDKSTRKPIDNAQVFLLGGDQPVSSLTNAKGLLIFDGLQPAVYRVRVDADGYDEAQSNSVEVDQDQRIDVAVALQPHLKTIASVHARSSVSVTLESVSADSAQRKVSQSLSDALNKIAGVSVDSELYGADSAFNISLHGADASRTGYTVDGMQMGGAAAQAMGNMQDLFSGASVNFAPSAMNQAGTVNFFTIQPTKIWNYEFTGIAGNDSNTLGSWTITGGAGKVAFALQHTAGGEDSPLQGMDFADQTGSSYVHQGGFSRIANLVKASVDLSPVSRLKIAYLTGRANNAYICSSATTLLPCSSGPDSGIRSRNADTIISFGSLAGHVQYNAFLNSGWFTMSDSEPNRAVNGTLSPFFSSGKLPWESYGAYASVTAKRHTLSAGMYGDMQTGTYTSTYDATQLTTSVTSSRDGSIWASDKVKSNDKLALTHSVSQSWGTGAGSALELGEDVTWQPARDDTFDASADFGSAESSSAYSSPIGDPLSADYDCYNGSVYVDGPVQPAVRQWSAQYSLAWRHSFKGGFIKTDIYRNNFYGQSLRLAVPITGEPDSLFPDGSLAAYLASIENVWSQPAMCGSIPFTPQHVYVNQIVSGLPQVNRGADFSAQIPLGKNVIAFPHYATTSVYLSTLDPRLIAPGSYYAPGMQLPHHPLQSAGLIIDGIWAHKSFEWLLDAEFTSANNPQNLPAYTVYNAGVIFHTSMGSVRVFEANLFGSHTGLFTTYQGVNPMPVMGGGSFAYATTPLPPRSFTVEYQVRWHQHQSPPKKAPAKKP